MRIKAFWSLYGPTLHRAGKNLDCGDGSSWSNASYHLINRLEHEGYTGDVEFYGPCASDIKSEYESYLSIK